MALGFRKIFTKATVMFLIVLAILLFTDLVFGAEERVRIVATKSGSYNFEDNTFVGLGDVEVSVGDLVLRGDELHVNFTTGEAQLKGSVNLVQDGQEISGEFLTYNLETGEGVFEEARSEIELAKKTGTIFLFGESVDIVDQKYKINNAQVTTCDLQESHFHVSTKELEVILGEKMIIRGVTYYEGKIPIFYWPYIVIPLDSTDENRFFSLPVLGYGEHEGYYMKNTFNYYLNSKSYGNLYLDLFSRLGAGFGVRHHYDLTKLGKGSLYIYGLPSKTSPVFKSAINHEWKNDNWVFKTSTSQDNSQQNQTFKSDHRLSLTLPKLTAEVWYNYQANLKATISKRKEYGGRWSQNLTDQWRLNIRGTWTERETTQILKLLDYLAETSYQQGKHNWTLGVQQQYNPDLLDNITQPWRNVQRIPELKWEVSDLGLTKLPLQSQVLVGRYEEQPSRVRQTRLFTQLSLKPKVWRPLENTSFNYQGDLGTAVYGDRQQQTWLYGRISLNQRLSSHLQLSSTYSQREAWGTSPFRFDKQLPTQSLSFNLSYNDPKWRLSANSSYNFKQKTFSTLVLQAHWRPEQAWNLDLYSYYDLNVKKIVRIVPMAKYKRDQVELQLGGRYLPGSKTWERLDAQLSVPFGETWQVGYNSIYEPPKQKFTQGQVTITKDLHCRELSVSYDHVVKRVALQYTIKAFPTLPIGWDSQGGISLFDLEKVSDIIGMKE